MSGSSTSHATGPVLTAPPPGTLGSDPPASRLPVFAFLWAAYTLFHQARESWSFSPVDLATSMTAVAVLCRPANLRLFLILNVLHVVNLYDRMPEVSNHSILNLIVSLAILTAALRLWLRGGRAAIPQGRLYSDFAPAARLAMLVAYGWAAFHKYNWDFVHLPVSAAVEHYLRLGHRITTATGMHLLPTGEWALVATVLATLLVESAIPLLLLFRRTRLIGISIALVFHFVVGMDHFADFSSLLYALLFLFLPDDFVTVARARWEEFSRRIFRIRERVAALRVPAAGWAMAAFFLGVAVTGNVWSRVELAFQVLWVFYALGVLVVYFALLPAWRRRTATFDRLRLPAPGYAVFPLLVLLNGASPYLGLKTRSSFAMYSNLRTELRWDGDRSNHVLVPSTLKLAGFQEDLVRLLETNHRYFAPLVRSGEYRTYYEFRRHISEVARRGATGISVTYLRGGVRRSVPNAERDPELSRRYPYLMRKFLSFADVSAVPRQRNRH